MNSRTVLIEKENLGKAQARCSMPAVQACCFFSVREHNRKDSHMSGILLSSLLLDD